MMKRAPLLKRIKRSKCINWITQPFNVGLVITILYLGVISIEAKLSGDWATKVDAEKLNSLGDFLAGLFAPVAFLWLIVTVFLQKQELKLTRDELIEQRKAMQDQAKEAKANTVFVEKQTNIMSDQAEQAKITYFKNRKLQMFDKRMELYNEIKRFTERNWEQLSTEPSKKDLIHLTNKVFFLFAGDETLYRWMYDLQITRQKLQDRLDTANDRSQWAALISDDLFHMRFKEHLTIYE
ncbi:hypothetical protein ACQZ45_25595 [Agrobacterium sp. 16-2014-1-2a]